MKVLNIPAEKAEELMDNSAVQRFRKDAQRLARSFVSLFDFDPSLEIFQCKMIDAMCRSVEKVRDNTEQAGLAANAEMKALERANSDTEFDVEAHDRIVRRLNGLRIQFWTARLTFEALLDARADVISASGIDWPSYQTLKQMSAQNNTKRRMREAAIRANALLGMSEQDYRRWLRDGAYTAKHNGIDADDEQGAGQANVENFQEAQRRRDLLKADADKKLARIDEIDDTLDQLDVRISKGKISPEDGKAIVRELSAERERLMA